MLENNLKTKSNNLIPSAAIGGMKWTWNVYGPVNLQKSKETLRLAIDKGFIHIDTADCYAGSDGNPDNETFIGRELQQYFNIAKISREDLFIATKCAIKLDPRQPWRRDIDISPAYILGAVEKSLNRLQVDYIDLLYLHRISEAHTPVEESMRVMHELRKEGKIRYIGISEPSPDIIIRADSKLKQLSNNKQGLDAIQTEYNLLRRGPEVDGVFSICRQLGISFFAYSPLSRGLTTGTNIVIEENDCRNGLDRFQGENLLQNQKIMERLKALTIRLQCSMSQLSLAWLQHQSIVFGIKLYPIFGTSNPDHLLENIHALTIKLDDSDLSTINVLVPIGIAKGLRYPKADMIEFNLLPD